MAKREVKTTLILEDKSFVNDKGEVVEYTDKSVVIAGQCIGVKVKSEDKGLLDYLVSTVGTEVK